MDWSRVEAAVALVALGLIAAACAVFGVALVGFVLARVLT